MQYHHKHNPSLGTGGFASLVVVLTLIIILSLITVGFAQFIRREQTNALNKQLSSQAFYAAESAVNDVHKILQVAQQSGAVIDSTYNKTGCGPAAGKYVSLDASAYSLDAGHNVSYTCLMVDVNPDELTKNPLSLGSSWTPVFQTVDSSGNPVSLGSLVVKWSATSPTSSAETYPSSPGTFPPQSGWTWKTGMLRVSITPLAGIGLTHDALAGNTFTTFLYPSQSGPQKNISFTTGTGANGPIGVADCDGGLLYDCSVTISGIPVNTYYMVHVEPIYENASVQLKAPGGINFSGAQAVVDATGKAQDVLRRIRVTLSLTPTESFPSALEAQDICKRMKVYSTGTDFVDIAGGPAGLTNQCWLSN